MAQNINITRTSLGSATLVRLTGIIDETFQKSAFDNLTGIVLFDLDGVRRITSYGVREWMLALRSINAAWYGFINVHPTLLAQFNMVAGFAGQGQVVTFFSPNVCPQCGKEVEIRIDLRKEHPSVKRFDPPAATCHDCRTRADFDDIAESFFSYVAAAPPPNVPAEVSTILDGASTPSTPFKVVKEIDEDVTALWASGSLDQRSQFRRLAEGLEGDVVMTLSDVKSVTSDGMAKLWQFVDGGGFKVYLAQIPFPVAEYLSSSSDTYNAKLVSVRLPFECEQKHKQVIDLDSVELALLGIVPMPEGCSTCSGALSPAIPDDSLKKIVDLRLVSAPSNVKQYLSKHRAGPGAIPIPKPQPLAPDNSGESWGRYKLRDIIGTGGMAQVYLARQVGPEGFEKKVVLKRLLPHLTSNQKFVEMFLQEARVAARLSHPNIVQIFDLGRIEDAYFIAMEYVKGWDLNALLRAAGTLNEPIPLPIVLRIICDVCDALDAAHRATDDDGRSLGIVHRDVSPQNILISREGVVKLTDFGIAKAAGSLQLTEPGTIRGKLAYMSPEQVRGIADVDARADVFAVGVVLYQCLTFEQIFKRDNDAATLLAVIQEVPQPVSTKRGGTPRELDQIVLKALSKDREWRYESTRDIRAGLEKLGPASVSQLGRWLELLQARAGDHGYDLMGQGGTPTLPAKKKSEVVPDGPVESSTTLVVGKQDGAKPK